MSHQLAYFCTVSRASNLWPPALKASTSIGSRMRGVSQHLQCRYCIVVLPIQKNHPLGRATHKLQSESTRAQSSKLQVPNIRRVETTAREARAMNKSVAEAARRIFGNLPASKGRSGNKVLRKNMIGRKIAEVRRHRGRQAKLKHFVRS